MFDWLFRRWHLKVLALALAFAVWVAVTGEGRGVQDFHVPVDVVLGNGAALSGSPPTNVTVRLRGPGFASAPHRPVRPQRAGGPAGRRPEASGRSP